MARDLTLNQVGAAIRWADNHAYPTLKGFVEVDRIRGYDIRITKLAVEIRRIKEGRREDQGICF